MKSKIIKGNNNEHFSEKKLSSWNGHKAFTDCSEPMPYDSAIW